MEGPRAMKTSAPLSHFTLTGLSSARLGSLETMLNLKISRLLKHSKKGSYQLSSRYVPPEIRSEFPQGDISIKLEDRR